MDEENVIQIDLCKSAFELHAREREGFARH
jgi:hypothetical protein